MSEYKAGISRFVCSFDYAKLNNTYDIYRLMTDEKRLQYGAKILDLQQITSSVQAVAFLPDKRSLYVMMPKSRGSRAELTAAVASNDPEGHYKVGSSLEDFADIPDYIILRLLRNAVNNSDVPVLAFSNVTGRLLKFHHYGVFKGSPTRDIVVALELWIGTDLSVQMYVRTFVSKNLSNLIHFEDGKNWYSYPHYYFDENTLQMLRVLDENSDKLQYIQRTIQLGRKIRKNEVGFFAAGGFDVYKDSKLGVLAEFMSWFNTKYDGLAHITLAEQPFEKYDVPRRVDAVAALDARVNKGLSGGVRVVDKVQNDTSSALSDWLVRRLCGDGILACVAKDVVFDRPNFVLVHAADYYAKRSAHDDYDDYRGAVLQHVVVDDKKVPLADAVYRALKTNLLIKQDIRNNRVTAVDLSGLMIKGCWQFCMRSDFDDDAVCVMELAPDDGIRMNLFGDMFEFMEFGLNPDLYEAAMESGVRCSIMDDSGNVCRITDTGLFSIPDLDGIGPRLEYIKENDLKRGRGKLGLRGEKPILQGTEWEIDNALVELFSAIHDINYVKDDAGIMYWVGEHRKDWNASNKVSQHIYRIEGENADGMWTALLPTFTDAAVRNGQMSVLPFAVKYMREYMLMHEKD